MFIGVCDDDILAKCKKKDVAAFQNCTTFVHLELC